MQQKLFFLEGFGTNYNNLNYTISDFYSEIYSNFLLWMLRYTYKFYSYFSYFNKKVPDLPSK